MLYIIMAYFIHLGHSKSVPKHALLQTSLSKQPYMSGSGYAGAKKKDLGSMKSISGEGVRNKKIAPLRFKM